MLTHAWQLNTLKLARTPMEEPLPKYILHYGHGLFLFQIGAGRRIPRPLPIWGQPDNGSAEITSFHPLAAFPRVSSANGFFWPWRWRARNQNMFNQPCDL